MKDSPWYDRDPSRESLHIHVQYHVESQFLGNIPAASFGDSGRSTCILDVFTARWRFGIPQTRSSPGLSSDELHFLRFCHVISGSKPGIVNVAPS